jgi:hypothetical protein
MRFRARKIYSFTAGNLCLEQVRYVLAPKNRQKLQ